MTNPITPARLAELRKAAKAVVSTKRGTYKHDVAMGRWTCRAAPDPALVLALLDERDGALDELVWAGGHDVGLRIAAINASDHIRAEEDACAAAQRALVEVDDARARWPRRDAAEDDEALGVIARHILTNPDHADTLRAAREAQR